MRVWKSGNTVEECEAFEGHHRCFAAWTYGACTGNWPSYSAGITFFSCVEAAFSSCRYRKRAVHSCALAVGQFIVYPLPQVGGGTVHGADLWFTVFDGFDLRNSL